MSIRWTNNAASVLASDITAGTLSITVTTGHGDRFPEIVAPHYCMVTLMDSSGNREIVKVTARDSGSNTMTITRAQEGTSARSFAAGSLVELRITKNAMDEVSKAADINENHYVCDASAADQGAAVNSASLKSIVDSLGATEEATIELPHTGTGDTTTYTVGTNLTIPATVTLRVHKGARVSPSAGVTLTVNGIVQAGAYTIFAGAGTVTVSTYPQDQAWWGSTQRLDVTGLSIVPASQAETDAGALDTKIVTPAKLYATPGVYRKNAVINGDMMVWQRGTTFTASANGAFHADRWSHIATTDAVVTVSKSTNVPTDAQGIGRFAASLQVDVTTADTSIGSGQAHAICYKVEGYDIRGLVGQVCTLSFWVYATKTGIYCVNLLCSGADHSYVKEYTINSANTWEKKTITFTLDASSGTWDFTNGVGLQIRWTLAAGSNYQTATDGVWGTALYATANQVNGLDSSDNYFLLTGVQLEKGSAATPFEYRHFAEELALCQRYFEKSYGQSTYPGKVTSVGRIFFTSAIAYDYGYCPFKVTKRADATVVFYSPKTGASGYCYDYTSDANVALTGYTSEFGAGFSGSLTTAHLFAVHYTASAEL